ncbi:MAG TPA: DivIVA domain-containing protein [Fimbriimonadaceae bacterium]|nr:DivIVA domain-containing protein [Fimbriimonadaceae bacterium]
MSTEQPATQEVELPLHRGMFGYRRAEVDAALDAAEAERGALRSDLAATRLELERVRAQLSEREAQAGDTRAELVQARQQLEQDRQSILKEKEMILEAAHELAEEIQRRAQRRITEEGWELHRARIERQRFVESFRGLLLKYMDEIDRLASGLADQAAVVAPSTAVTDIPAEVFSAAAERLFVPPGFEAPEPSSTPSKERFSS